MTIAVLYFAYGSNMEWQQMRDRCPSAKFVCVAKLEDHRLAFTRKSIKRGCGVVDAVAGPGDEVWGVVFQIDDRDIDTLDAKEGFVRGRETNAYVRREISVLENGDANRPISVMTYFVAKKEMNVPSPNSEYRRLLVEGAKHWHLPAEYITKLEKIEANG